jgi:hypothetical protein
VVKVPKTARGKIVRGAITASHEGSKVTKTFSAHIK